LGSCSPDSRLNLRNAAGVLLNLDLRRFSDRLAGWKTCSDALQIFELEFEF